MSKHSVHSGTAIVTSAWQGPVPPPEALERYNAIVPNAAERILTMAEEEARIRRDQMQKDHDSENRVKESDINQYHSDVKRGQYLAALVMLGIVATIVICVVFNQGAAAIAVAGMGAVGIVSSFIGRRK